MTPPRIPQTVARESQSPHPAIFAIIFCTFGASFTGTPLIVVRVLPQATSSSATASSSLWFS
jgi:hypothetical protein